MEWDQAGSAVMTDREANSGWRVSCGLPDGKVQVADFPAGDGERLGRFLAALRVVCAEWGAWLGVECVSTPRLSETECRQLAVCVHESVVAGQPPDTVWPPRPGLYPWKLRDVSLWGGMLQHQQVQEVRAVLNEIQEGDTVV